MTGFETQAAILRAHAGRGLPCDLCGARCIVDDPVFTPVQIVGVDPGPIPGVALLTAIGPRLTGRAVFQCDPGSAAWLVHALLTRDGPAKKVFAVERFVVGPRAGRLSTPRAAAATRNMVGALVAFAEGITGVKVVQRCAAEVMPWASDRRLTEAGLHDVTKAMPHARAAARHALFAAVRDGGMADPISVKARVS